MTERSCRLTSTATRIITFSHPITKCLRSRDTSPFYMHRDRGRIPSVTSTATMMIHWTSATSSCIRAVGAIADRGQGLDFTAFDAPFSCLLSGKCLATGLLIVERSCGLHLVSLNVSFVLLVIPRILCGLDRCGYVPASVHQRHFTRKSCWRNKIGCCLLRACV